MDLFIIILLVILIVLCVILTIVTIKKSTGNFDTNSLERKVMDASASSTASIAKSVADSNGEIKENLQNNFGKLLADLEKRVNEINERLSESVKGGFKDTNETIKTFQEKMAVIENTQKQINELTQNILGLEKILGNNKETGNFGESLLSDLLHAYYGDETKLYELQYQFKNKNETVTPDAIIHFPNEILCIDSKFPVHFYKQYLDDEYEDKEAVLKELSKAIKKQIDEIYNKYIVEGITTEYACMFVPSDSLLATIHNKIDDCIKYASDRKILLLSPSTLIAFISNIKQVKLEYERNMNAKDLYESIKSLGEEFGRFVERWNALSKTINSLVSEQKDLTITADKITKRFKNLKEMNFDDEN